MTPISPHTWNSELTGGPGGAAGSAGAGAAFVGPLDDYDGAIAAFTFTKAPFAASISLPVVRLRRSSDNAESDFGFIESGSDYVLDTASISTWKGAATLYLRSWYDVSGNGNHLGQSTAGSQPTFSLTGGPGNGPYCDMATSAKSLVPGQVFSQHTGAVCVTGVQNHKFAFRRSWVFSSGLLGELGTSFQNIFVHARATATESAVAINVGAAIGPVVTAAANWHTHTSNIDPAGSPKIRTQVDASVGTSSPASITVNVTKVTTSTVSAECFAGGIFWLRALTGSEQDAVHAWIKEANGL